MTKTLSARQMTGWKTKNHNSSTTNCELWRNAGPSALQLQETTLKSDKIWCKYLVVNCVSLRTFWTTLLCSIIDMLSTIWTIHFSACDIRPLSSFCMQTFIFQQGKQTQMTVTVMFAECLFSWHMFVLTAHAFFVCLFTGIQLNSKMHCCAVNSMSTVWFGCCDTVYCWHEGTFSDPFLDWMQKVMTKLVFVSFVRFNCLFFALYLAWWKFSLWVS